MATETSHCLPTVASLTEAAMQMRDGVQAQALTGACLAQVSDPKIEFNGFVRTYEDKSMAVAAELDRKKAAGQECGPLHGIPLAHKDMFFQAGELSECGSRILTGYRPDHTATVLQRLADAGAVNIGALHMAEFAMSPTGFNAHLGHGRNPWSPAHVTGGSSSGSGVAVASRLVFGALGSDTGGSVRIPAAACGVTGLKPTQYAISTYGVMPLAPSLDCVGVLAQTARDCARLLTVVSGPDTRDPRCLATRSRDFEATLDLPVSFPEVVAVPDFPSDVPLTEEVRALVERAASALSSAGVVLRRVPIPDLAESGALASLVLGVEAASVHAKWLAERADDYGHQVRRRLQRGLLYPGTRYMDALRLRAEYQARFLAAHLRDAGALLLPVLPCAVPTIEETTVGSEAEIEKRFGSFSYWTRGINYLGLPALALPAGFTENGLPNGIQLIGKPFGEGALLRLGEIYQRQTDWHLRRPPCSTSRAQ